MIRFTISGGDLFNELFDDEDKKVAADIYTDVVLNVAVDTGALKNDITLDLTGMPSVSAALPYANRIMNEGHSKQTPTGTLDNIVAKHTDS